MAYTTACTTVQAVMEIYVKISFISIFFFFLAFNHDFVIYTDFIHVAASNTATDDVTN